MKYFIHFKNGRASVTWERETENEHPNYIKDNIFEVTKEQYDLNRFLTLENDQVVWDQPRYDNYLQRVQEIETAKTEREQFKAAIAEVDSWNSFSDVPFAFFKKFCKRVIKDMAEE